MSALLFRHSNRGFTPSTGLSQATRTCSQPHTSIAMRRLASPWHCTDARRIPRCLARVAGLICSCWRQIWIDLFPTLGVGLLDFKLSHYSSPGLCLVFWHTSENPQCRIQRPSPSVSLECPTQPQIGAQFWGILGVISGVPNSAVSLECPTPEYPRSDVWSAQIQRVSLEFPSLSVPGVPNPRMSLECNPRISNAQPLSIPGVPTP